MKKKDKLIYLGAVLILLVVWSLMMTRMEADVSEVGQPPHKIEKIFGVSVPFNGINTSTILNTWLVIAILVGLSYFAGRKFKELPGNREWMCLEIPFLPLNRRKSLYSAVRAQRCLKMV